MIAKPTIERELSEEETVRRRDDALRRALKTPPPKRETKGKPKDKKSQSSDRNR
jgi:hypothetical protein